MDALQQFMQEEFREGLLVKIGNLSYYPLVLDIPTGHSRFEFDIAHVNVDGSICLRKVKDELSGKVNIIAINPFKTHETAYSKGLFCLRQFIERGEFEVPINLAGIYFPKDRISFYSGEPGKDISWTFHCRLSGNS